MALVDGRPDTTSSLTLGYRSPVLFCVAALWLALFAAECARPCFFLHDDNASSFLGSYVHDYRVLATTGRVAEVDYYQYGGEPFLEQGQTGVLYPPVYFAVALAKAIPGSTRWTIEWLAALHLTFGLVGFYGWMRQNGVAHGVAAIASLAWVLQPFVMIIASSWIMVTYVAAWMPWLFWATDRLLIRPSIRWASVLGIFFGLFFLQGYVQWVVYAALFLGLYVIFSLCRRAELPRVKILYYLLIASIFFLILTLPLMLPMLHAVENSAARAQPLSILQALFYRAEPADILPAQVGLFRPHFMFGITSAILFCPALGLVPVMVFAFVRGGAEQRSRLFPLLILAALALILSSRWHIMLTVLPVFERFRWPFKVFLFVDFFLLAALAQSVSSWSSRRLAACLMALVLAGSAAISFGCHDNNFFSKDGLPPGEGALVRGMDPHLGRVIAIDDQTPDTTTHLFLSHAYGTYFAMPSLGGYNPLVARDRLEFSLGLDFPNLYRGPIDADVRAKLDERAVRYWIVAASSPFLAQIPNMDGIETIVPDANRVVFVDTHASPLIYSVASPTDRVPFQYSGNSLLLSLVAVASPIAISLGPTDGWWYRMDNGKWISAPYKKGRLVIPFGPTDRLLEVSFFDSRFRKGLVSSFYLIVLLTLTTIVSRRFFRR